MDFIVIVYSMFYCSIVLLLYFSSLFILYVISSSVTGRTQLYYLCEVSVGKKKKKKKKIYIYIYIYIYKCINMFIIYYICLSIYLSYINIPFLTLRVPPSCDVAVLVSLLVSRCHGDRFDLVCQGQRANLD